jgi:hypothetical protein
MIEYSKRQAPNGFFKSAAKFALKRGDEITSNY